MEDNECLNLTQVECKETAVPFVVVNLSACHCLVLSHTHLQRWSQRANLWTRLPVC